MLRQAKDFRNYQLRARDGDIGRAEEFYFDDRYWTVRYLVVETRGWLSGRQVLISPYALYKVDGPEKVLPVSLTKKQIEDSPSLNSDQPVSRQFELDYHGYYRWPYYGYGTELWGPYALPSQNNEARRDAHLLEKQSWDPNLRSTKDVSGHTIQALDGPIGHVEDFIIDDETWTIRYLVVETKNFWPGKHVLVSPQWVQRVSWSEKTVFINLTCELIRQAPEFSPETLSRDYEHQLFKHYDKSGYWIDEPVALKR